MSGRGSKPALLGSEVVQVREAGLIQWVRSSNRQFLRPFTGRNLGLSRSDMRVVTFWGPVARMLGAAPPRLRGSTEAYGVLL